MLSIVGDLPLVVRGAQGFGRVTLIGLDVDQKLFSNWADRGLFWARAIDLRPIAPTSPAPAADHRREAADSTSRASPTFPASSGSASSSFPA